MKDGIEFAIKLLEKHAARHKYLGTGDFTKGDAIVQRDHFISAEACLCVVRNLKVKLRSLKSKESAITASNKPSDEICPFCRGRLGTYCPDCNKFFPCLYCGGTGKPSHIG